MGSYSLDFEDNQFWGRIVRSHTGWYAVLHKFDSWGRHIGTDHWFAGEDRPWSGAPERANAKLDEMVTALGNVDYADIEIRLWPLSRLDKVFEAAETGQLDNLTKAMKSATDEINEALKK